MLRFFLQKIRSLCTDTIKKISVQFSPFSISCLQRGNIILQWVRRKITCVFSFPQTPSLGPGTSPAFSWPSQSLPLAEFLQQPLPTSLLESQSHPPAVSRPQRERGLCTRVSYWKRLSLTKLQPGSSEHPSQVEFSFELLCLPLHCPILAKLLLSQFRQNLPPSISEHPQYLIKFPHPSPSSRWYLITLACHQHSCQFGLARIFPYLWFFLLVIFHPLSTTLLCGCKSPFVHYVPGTEPSSKLRPLFFYCSNFWIKSAFTSFTSVWLWFYLTLCSQDSTLEL